MQLLLNIFQNLIRNLFALICSLGQLVHVVSNCSQLASHFEGSLPINLGSSHPQSLCLLLDEGRHTHSRIFRHLLKFLELVIAHTKFNLPILFPVLDQNDRPFRQFSIGVMFYNRLYLPSIISALQRVGKLRIWYPNTACWGDPQPPLRPWALPKPTRGNLPPDPL